MNNNNKSQFFSTRKETIGWLKQHNVKNYTVNDNLSVDVNGSISLSYRNLKIIPVKFGNVTGGFFIQNNNLINLIGSPETVGGSFWAYNNELTNLVGSPKIINDDFCCHDNIWLTSLVGAPKYINGCFSCENSKLRTLLEINNCIFKEGMFFNIDEKNFKPKELIQILKKYYSRERKYYTITYDDFNNIIKPRIEKNNLQQKLNIFAINTKTKNNFI